MFIEEFAGVKKKNQSNSSRGKFRELFAKIKDISPSGKVKIEFSENLNSKKKEEYPKVDEALQVFAMIFDFELGYSIPIEL